MADFSWLTEPTAPWWATVGAPIATFWLGQHFANRGAAEQRTADLADREKERSANLASVEKQINGERLKSAEERAEQARVFQANVVRDTFAAALDAMAKLHGALALSAAEPQYGPADDDGNRKMVADATPVSTETFQEFISAMNRLRLFDGDEDFDATELISQISGYMESWSSGFPGYRNVTTEVEGLANLADKVSSAYRVRHA